MEDTAQNFRVDLHGLVDLLSRHLYSSPRVYVRELLQNAVDAITARRLVDPTAPASIRITTSDRTVTVTDTGIGLSPDQVVDFLATIGRSSKRDDIGFAREEFLGQFGIGLLSAFMVAEEISIQTRTRDGDPVSWTGTADGSYRTTAGDPAAEVGTSVTLRARRGSEDWLLPAMIRDLVLQFGPLLPVEISLDGERLPTGRAPWEEVDADTRRAELVGYAQEHLGITPFDVIDLHVPAVGLRGVAYVVPIATNPAEASTHQVFLKRMLLSDHAAGLVPEWAFFVRCVVDVAELRPTASREALYEDGALEEAREAVGAQVRGWLTRLARTRPERLAEFLRIHHLGVKGLAMHDDEMLSVVADWLPLETSHGSMTPREFASAHGTIRYTSSVDEFRQLATVAASQGIGLVNGGYTYEADLLERMDLLGLVVAERFEPSELAGSFDTLDAAAEQAVRPLVLAAQRTLDGVGCEVVVRAFDPAGLSALYIVDRSAIFAAERRRTREQVGGLWADVLGMVEDRAPDVRPQLVLNHRNELVRRLASVPADGLVQLAVEAMYGQALLQGRHPVSAADSALVNRSLLGLLERAVPPTSGRAAE